MAGLLIRQHLVDSDIYHSTQEAWRRIWRDEADLARELQTTEYARARRTYSLFQRFLPRDGILLEAGSGLGKELVRLKRGGYRIVGVDYAENALKAISAYEPGHLVAAGDIHELPFPEETFAAYLSFGVLEHFDFGPGPALREAHRVLRPSGLLILTIGYPSLVWRMARLVEWKADPRRGEGTRYYETTYTLGALDRHLHHAGFTRLAAHPIGHSFTLWGLGGAFRGKGYYETSPTAERMGAILRRVLPWPMCFQSLIVARKKMPPD